VVVAAVAVLVVRPVSSECRYHNDEASWVVHPSFYYPAGNCAVCVVLAAAIIAAAAVATTTAAAAVVAGAIIAVAGAVAVLLAVALVVAVCLPHRL